MNSLMLSAKSQIAFFLFMVYALLSLHQYVSGESRPRSTSPEFHVKLLDGTAVAYENLQGKVTVIDFWGTWCKPCLEEIPAHNAFCRNY
jgi:thiol-disulfide isomerase/thioredoxin